MIQDTIADTADLVVLGAYYATGSKGGQMSVFLMGCRDAANQWRTVCKCGSGLDDKGVAAVNAALQVTAIHRNPALVPAWLRIAKPDLVPDFVVKDPRQAPVWEILTAEFSKSTRHSADGISMRHPRIIRIRDDKDWQTATSLDELKALVAASGRAPTAVDESTEQAEEEAEEDSIGQSGEIKASVRPVAQAHVARKRKVKIFWVL